MQKDESSFAWWRLGVSIAATAVAAAAAAGGFAANSAASYLNAVAAVHL